MRLFIIVAILGLLAGAFILPFASEQAARIAMKPNHRDAEWAPGLVYMASRVNMRLWRYECAADLLQEGLSHWPQAWWQAKGTYFLALSHECSGRHNEAQQWYTAFMTRYPDHQWSRMAQKRASNIDVNN